MALRADTGQMRLMRSTILGTLLLVLSAGGAQAGPQDEAMAVVNKWVQAFNASDVDAITQLYAPDALFMGTGSRAVVTDPAGVRRYFEQALLTQRPRSARVLESTALVLSDSAVVVNGLDVTSAVRDGTTVESPGRFTFVVARRGAEWRIVHFHRSGMPGGGR
jgi:uncharacterized protein (TIGR02246 family)